MILQEIADKTKERISEAERRVPLKLIKDMALEIGSESSFPFEAALRRNNLSFICEVKKASPSKGTIVEDFPYVKIAKEYEEAGAAAISVLTEPYYFKGCNEYLTDIAEHVKVPLLRKDFTIHEYMIYEAKVLGAHAILLICALLEKNQLQEYLAIAHKLGLSALVEAHDEAEVQMALDTGARIIGVNNRNLHDFTVNINNSIQLRKRVPKEVLYIAESGIRSKEDTKNLREHGVNGVLIGESLMRAANKRKLLEEMNE